MSVPGDPDAARGVVVVEDHRLLAQAVAMSLAAQEVPCEVLDLAGAADLDALRRDLEARPPAVLWLDLDLAGLGDGGRLVAPLTAAGWVVVVVTGEPDEARWGRALLAGARGVLPKSTPLPVMLSALEAARSGGDVTTAGERDRLVALALRAAAEEEARLAPLRALSPREAEVLRLLGEGVPAAGIADRAVVSETTVRAQIRAVLRKLGVSSQLQAVAVARRAGWTGPVPVPAVERRRGRVSGAASSPS
ncbi:LuxR C-terminal-related transcriptional regulator [Aquipuribacter nitratireducens]|uniref:LuxR C-terminal-related transcriptional regulator n=1 Tax=Aquipuribacter nitratireducens TaxID=650104 RepID=A0ABW0GUW9_9MICO